MSSNERKLARLIGSKELKARRTTTAVFRGAEVGERVELEP
jgi:hypothetical protein